jgi:CRP-like cAMP-binding protein
MATLIAFPGKTSAIPDGPATVSSILARRLDVIGSSVLFQDLTSQELCQAALRARSRIYDRNQYLFHQGEPASQLLLIDYGSVKLSQVGVHGHEAILSLCGTRDTLGVSVLLGRNNYSSSARVVAKCRALVWDRDHFAALLASNPQIRENLDRVLLQRIQELGDRFAEIASENVEQRVALVLLRVLSQMGRNCIPGIEVCLSSEELAQLAGTNLLTVSRVMSRWCKQGLLQPRQNAFKVLDPAGLSAVCRA